MKKFSWEELWQKRVVEYTERRFIYHIIAFGLIGYVFVITKNVELGWMLVALTTGYAGMKMWKENKDNQLVNGNVDADVKEDKKDVEGGM